MKIDFHNHFFPKEYVKVLEKRSQSPTVERDSSGRTLIHYAGDYNIVEEAHTTPDVRIKEMDRCGMDMQVLSLTTPGLESIEPENSVTLATIVNDSFSMVVQKYPERFRAVAALPLLDIDSAVEELDRSVTSLGLSGATIFSSVAGKHIDSQEFWPIYEKASQLDVPLFIHPTTPSFGTAFDDYRIVPLLGFVFDTTVTITRMVFAGVFEKWPKLKIILGHLGGTMPYLAERIDNGYRAYTECKKHITKLPSEYLRQTYLDTVSFHAPALNCAYEFTGPNQLVLGSDFPHQIGSLERSITSIESLDFPDSAKEKIFGENGIRLLKLN